MSIHTPHPDLPPPASTVGVVGWLRTNLFSSPIHSVFTLIAIYFIAITLPPMVDWVFISSVWAGDSNAACQNITGACWTFINVRFDQFMYGFYPEEEYWRVNLAFALVVLLAIPLFIERFQHKGKLGAFILFVYPFIAFQLFSGGNFGLPVVETSNWGGLTLTLIIATVGMVASFPLGVILALGRRSQMPIARSICVVFIEFWRGVPLITVLFMSSVMLPLFLPEGTHFDKLLRAMIGVALFQSAYIAEVVRGGLAAIPKGQYEAAEGLGLNYWQSMGLIILPQALKLVIPGIVNTFIALFKDTTLVLIIGLFDLLQTVQSAFKDPNWLEYAIEGYIFAAFVFWIFCFGMSRYSMALERKLHTGHSPR